jgi:hypothetical protein
MSRSLISTVPVFRGLSQTWTRMKTLSDAFVAFFVLKRTSGWSFILVYIYMRRLRQLERQVAW